MPEDYHESPWPASANVYHSGLTLRYENLGKEDEM
jgi:hypothetical protein